MNEPKYIITGYDDHVTIKGFITLDILMLLRKMCKKDGFTHLKFDEQTQLFSLVRRPKEGKAELVAPEVEGMATGLQSASPDQSA